MRAIVTAGIAVAAAVLIAAGVRAATETKAAGAGDATKTAKTDAKDTKMAEAMFGAGCFWGVEVTYRNTKGVTEAAVGYAGGQTENPTYKQVCTGQTGHAEVVHIKYDPAATTYEELLKVFFENHDPTQVNRQGPDHGTQYRTVIFYYTPEQKAAAEKFKADLDASKKFARPIATQIVPAAPFYRAEEYHQRYLEKHGLASCHLK